MAFVWVSAAWFFGIALASLAPLQLWQWLSLAAGCVFSTITFRQDHRSRSLFALLTFLFLGGARWASSKPDLNQDHVAFYADIGHEVQVTGTLLKDPDVRETYTLLELSSERIWVPDLEIQKLVQGLVLVRASPTGSWQYGQRLKVTGFLERPPEDDDFSYRAFLARQGILAWMPEAYTRSLGMDRVNPLMELLHRIRQRALIEIQRLFPYPEAPLLAGILLGIESRIPEDLVQAYGRTGTTHIIAISGFNITILAGVMIASFGRWLGRTRGLIAAGIVIILYTLLVGADAPVVRAALMGSLALLARYIGRRVHGLTSLAVAGVIMTMISPQSILDAGFQLSFAATLGLILYAEPLGQAAIKLVQRCFPKVDPRRWGNILAEILLLTMAAQITTLPVIVWHFHQISLVSLLANAWILPLQPLLMILSGIATILGMLWHPLGQLIAWFAWPFSALTNQLVRLLANTPGAVLYTGAPSVGGLLGYYTLLFSITALWGSSWKQKIVQLLPSWVSARPSITATGSLTALTLATLLVWQSYQRQPDGLLHLMILDVGSGEAVLIRSPSGATILLNGGSSPVSLATELGHHLPYPNPQIDWLILGGTQYQQLAGLRDIVNMTSIQHALVSGNPGGAAYRRIRDQLNTAEIPVATAEVGMRLDLGDGSTLEVLTQGPFGVTILLQYGDARILLPTGLSPGEVPDLLSSPRTAQTTAVLLADGGYEGVNPDRLLRHFAPQLVLISSESGAYPSQLDPNLEEPLSGIPTLSTDLHGSMDLSSDGTFLWVTVDHNQADISSREDQDPSEATRLDS
ncbi:MAG: DUF4131 domain-containing protein [Anaerolineales bacterium]|nr:MAG: DUF4131 domain-containing protein [Anaerolineales bacterium]